MLAYAFFGTYEHGVASDFLSALWGMGLVIFQLAYNPVPLIMGIVGLVKQKGNVLMLIISGYGTERQGCRTLSDYGIIWMIYISHLGGGYDE